MNIKWILLVLLLWALQAFSLASKPDWAWAKSANGINNDEINGVSCDESGNTYITGYFSSPVISFGSTVLFNADTSGKSADVFIAKYDSSGNLSWAKSAGGKGNEKGWGISNDEAGNIYVTGFFSSPAITFSKVTLTNTSVGSSDIFITKYDKSGNVIWAKSFGGVEDECAFAVTADAEGNSFITGYYFSPVVSFDKITLVNSDSTRKSANIFTAKLDPSGTILWATGIGGSGRKNKGRSICTDSRGNAFISGDYAGNAVALGATLTDKEGAGKTKNIFVAKYDSSGVVLWINIARGSASDEGDGISTDSAGNAYVTGFFSSPEIILNSITLKNADPSGKSGDFIIAKYDPSGKVIWAKSAGGKENDWGHSIITDKNGNSYLTGGSFSNYIMLGRDTVLNKGGREQSVIFVVKFDTNGNAVRVQTPTGDIDNGEGRGISRDLNGNLLLGGTFFSRSITFNVKLTNAEALGTTSDFFVAKLSNETIKPGTGDWGDKGSQSAIQLANKLLPKAAQELLMHKIALNMVPVDGGTFNMGCSAEQGDDCNADEKPAHQVKVNSFKLCKYDVSQAEWEAIMGNNPSGFAGCTNCPVENVSWIEAIAFINKLNTLSGKKYRLPTEAEWEYAARGGNKSGGYRYAGSNDINLVAWYDQNSTQATHPLGQKQPNELGLYDMSGNVWQWCSDWYDERYYSISPSYNPKGPVNGTLRVARGGSWFFVFFGTCRNSIRNWCSPNNGFSNFGFRLAEDF